MSSSCHHLVTWNQIPLNNHDMSSPMLVHVYWYIRLQSRLYILYVFSASPHLCCSSFSEYVVEPSTMWVWKLKINKTWELWVRYALSLWFVNSCIADERLTQLIKCYNFAIILYWFNFNPSIQRNLFPKYIIQSTTLIFLVNNITWLLMTNSITWYL